MTEMKSWASFSPCRSHRFVLGRKWDDKPLVMFIGLNPSTADETQDDPTIRRCIGYAKDWGYGGLLMTNIFAYRSTDPKWLLECADPIGSQNDDALLNCYQEADIAIAAWGTHGTLKDRNIAVRKLLPKLHYLRLTKDGHPGHPLYLPKTLKPILWE